MKCSENRNTRGFTLVELLVTMGLGMVVLAAATTSFMGQTRFYSAQEQVNEMKQNARGALDIITRDLKMAGYNPAGTSFSGVTYSTLQLLIQADLDSSGILCTSSYASIAVNEQITYAHDNTNKQITRKLNSGTPEVVADNITACTFSYLDSAGAATTTTADTRQVPISITATTAKPDPNYTVNGGYRLSTVSATITPINLAL